MKKIAIMNKEKLKRNKIVILMVIISLGLFALYAFLLRPLFEKKMTTVVIETIITALLLVASIIAVICLVGSIIMTLLYIIRRKKGRKLWIGRLIKTLFAMVVVGAIAWGYVLYTQKEAYTPPILNEYGDEIPGSISALESVTIGDKVQWITARGSNEDNPVILFLSGLPGESSLASTRRTLSSLEESFVVVNWEQQGAGKSYNALDQSSVSLDSYISDGYELTKYLCQRFKKDKIYIMGESWGSILGMKLVQRSPELYNAFIGVGQTVSFSRSNSYSYYQAMELAANNADDKELRKLKAQGAPPYKDDNIIEKESVYLDYLKYHVDPDTNEENFIADISGPEYGLIDKFNYLRGSKTTFGKVYEKIYNIDLAKESTDIKVPVYFLQGRKDVFSPGNFVEEYYNTLNAPHKELIWFENSGHNLWFSEGDKFAEVVNKKVLKK